MAPTIQNGTTIDREKRDPQTTDKKSELLSKVKYCNTLPDFPFDTKFIRYPFPALRFVEYKPTSLEREYKYDLLTESDLGIEIDLINRDTFLPNLKAQLDPADEKLLEEDILTPQNSKRSKHHARSVSWLRRTEYISTEQTRFQPQTMDKVEAKVGYNIKKTLTEGILYMDRVSQIEAIKKTFEDCKKPIEKHHSKPNVVPVEILPVFPDFALWKYPCAQVIFDSDPAPVGRSVPAQIEEMSQAMIRGVMDESGEQFVAYFLPTQVTLEKRRRDVEAGVSYVNDEEYDYKISREYNWNVKSKTSKGYEENYYLVMREDGIYYNELETRVRLSKRRLNYAQAPNNTRLVVKHRPLTYNESKMHRFREKQLEPQGYDDDSDKEEEEQFQPQMEQTAEKAGSDNDAVSRITSRASSRASSAESRRKSRSRSHSKSKSKSRSPSKSKSRSRSKSKSRSRSRSKSTSRSKSSSFSPHSRSGSKSPADSRRKSRSRSVSAESNVSTLSGSRSRSTSRSSSKSLALSRSKSRSVSKSKTPSRSGSATENESGCGSNQTGSDTE